MLTLEPFIIWSKSEPWLSRSFLVIVGGSSSISISLSRMKATTPADSDPGTPPSVRNAGKSACQRRTSVLRWKICINPSAESGLWPEMKDIQHNAEESI
jgi:hypothetical protein